MEDNSACLMVMFFDVCLCVSRQNLIILPDCLHADVRLGTGCVVGVGCIPHWCHLDALFPWPGKMVHCVIEKGSEGKRKTNERSTVQDSLHNPCNKGCTRCTGVFSNVFVDEQRVVRDVVCIMCVCLCSHVFASKEKKHEAKTNKCSWNQ